MSHTAGYIIVRYEGEALELFWGFVGQSQTPHWVKSDVLAVRDLLLFENLVDAKKFRTQHARKLPASRVEPLIIGSEVKPQITYEDFQDKCQQEAESHAFDSVPADGFVDDAAHNTDEVTELVQTGSVTVKVGEDEYVLSIRVERQ